MSVDVTNSPYAAPPAGTPRDGLNYSRHYAQRIRDMGKSSKESWIKRLWNHMFPHKKNQKDESQEDDSRSSDSEEMGNKHSKNSVGTLPPINREGSLINVQQTGGKSGNPTPRDGQPHFTSNSSRSSNGKTDPKRLSTNSNPAAANGSANKPKFLSNKDRQKTIPVELANSPYIAPKDRPNYKVEKTKSVSAGKDPRKSKDGKDAFYFRKPLHPYLSQQQETWKPRITRAPNMINMEKRAKSTTEKAMREAKIFTCVGPYPVDAYVRFSLRKRGWVEKFGPKANASGRSGTSSKLECEDDEDFETICDQGVPPPWEEDHGIYAMMSRVARHYPAKFIWGSRNVNSLILKNEVIVNHFPKARYFSSKVLLSQSLKDLPWQNDCDPMEFFPRCFVLCEEEKIDIIDDFRITACIGILKWVLRMYLKSTKGHSKENQLMFQRENTKYEEVTSSKDCETDQPSRGSIFDDICTPEPSARGEMPQNSKSELMEIPENGKIRQPKVQFNLESENADCSNDETSQQDDFPGATSDSGDADLKDDDDDDKDDDADNDNADGDYEPCADVDDDNSDEKPKPTVNQDRVSASAGPERQEKRIPELQRSKSTNSIQTKSSSGGQKRAVLPDLKAEAAKKKGGEVPLKAVEWALFHLERHIMSKKNEDLDLKFDAEGKNPQGSDDNLFRRRGLSQPQWDQLLDWFYQISVCGAKVPITEGKLREAEEMLRRMKRIWPQYELDGKRNIWIVKPGDKSKGQGIEFLNKLDDILKYISNTTTQGTYVLQKYIERPLLIYRCKFDIRQWFLVTDWNPTTIWFYKESYLRICSQEFQYDSMHESVHLSNVAVQQNYLNGQRSDRLPDNNYLTSTDFKAYLSEVGAGHAWDEIIYPGMKKAVINTLVATQDVSEKRKNAFELYGADFMMSEDFRPWLIEINSSPGMAPTSVDKAKLCATVIEDTIKVVLDKRENRSAQTGGFELAFRDNPFPQTKCVETKLLLEGSRIKRPDLQRYMQIDQKMMRIEEDKARKEREKAEKIEKQRQETEKIEEETNGGKTDSQDGETKKETEEKVDGEEGEKKNENTDDKTNDSSINAKTNPENKTDKKKEEIKKSDEKQKKIEVIYGKKDDNKNSKSTSQANGNKPNKKESPPPNKSKVDNRKDPRKDGKK